jgi:hypothetical protein
MNQSITHDLLKPRNRIRTVNRELTRLIIKYHEQGYTEDFYINSQNRLLYSQSDAGVCYPWFTLTIVNQCYDSLTQGYKYIHAVETLCGVKGLLICAHVYFNY